MEMHSGREGQMNKQEMMEGWMRGLHIDITVQEIITPATE